MNFVAIDFETASYGRDSACSVGLVKVAGGKIVDQAVHLIRPPSREFVFTHIHGLTWADVATASEFGKLWPRIEPILEGADFLAAHNASFDKSVLKACCARYGIPQPALPFQCSVKIARAKWGIYPTKLSDVCRRLAIELNHHEALSDAMACARIVLAANSTANQAAPPPKKTVVRRASTVAQASSSPAGAIGSAPLAEGRAHLPSGCMPICATSHGLRRPGEF